MKVVNISFSDETIQKADAVASARGISRSDFVREAVEKLILESADTFHIQNDLAFYPDFLPYIVTDFNGCFATFWTKFSTHNANKSFQYRTVSEVFADIDETLTGDFIATIVSPMAKLGWLPEVLRIILDIDKVGLLRREIMTFILANWHWIMAIYDYTWLGKVMEDYWRIGDESLGDLKYPEENSIRRRITYLLLQEFESDDTLADSVDVKIYHLLKRLLDGDSTRYESRKAKAQEMGHATHKE